MDRLRQEFTISGAPDEVDDGMRDALSLWEVLNEHREPEPMKLPDESISGNPLGTALTELVRKVQGEDPKRWAHRIERRISDGDESVTFLQKEAAKSALR